MQLELVINNSDHYEQLEDVACCLTLQLYSLFSLRVPRKAIKNATKLISGFHIKIHI